MTKALCVHRNIKTPTFGDQSIKSNRKEQSKSGFVFVVVVVVAVDLNVNEC